MNIKMVEQEDDISDFETAVNSAMSTLESNSNLILDVKYQNTIVKDILSGNVLYSAMIMYKPD